MLVPAIGVTTLLVIASLTTRFAQDPEGRDHAAAADLAYKAMQWRETAAQDTEPTLRLQHAAYAMGYMHAARSLVRDDVLERRLGMNVSRLTRTIERHVMDARQTLRPRVSGMDDEKQ